MERFIYRVRYFEDWERGDMSDQLTSRDFKNLEEAKQFAQFEKNTGQTYSIEKVKQEYRSPPPGKVWKDEEFAWDDVEYENPVQIEV